MEELVNKIKEQVNIFIENADNQVENGNKAAGTRARKASLELDKMLKEFRKVSIEAGK
jgi:signal transduction histidine kinase